MFGRFQLPSNSPSVAAREALQGIQKKFRIGRKRKEDAAAGSKPNCHVLFPSHQGAKRHHFASQEARVSAADFSSFFGFSSLFIAAAIRATYSIVPFSASSGAVASSLAT